MCETVLVRRGRHGDVYHKDSGDGTPPCTVNSGDDPDNWNEWGIEKAEAWKEPCQNPDCYGDGELIGQKTGDTWPVKMD